MATTRVEMRSARPIRYGPGARALCEQIAQRVAARANAELPKAATGKQFVVTSQAGQRRPWGRWRVSVTAVGYLARRQEATHHTLVRALRAK